MTKKIKFIVATLVLALGFLFCFCLSVSVSADEGVDTKPTTQEEQPKEEKEDEATTDDEQINQVVDLFLNHLKDLKWDEFEAIFTFIGSYLGIDFILKVIMSVIVIVFKLRKDEQLKISKEALAMAEVEHKQNEEELKKQHNAELKELTAVMQNLKNEVKEFMNGQTEKIVSLTTDTTKEIANNLSKLSESLKDTE